MKNYLPKLAVVSCVFFSVSMLPASKIFGKNTKDNLNFVQNIEQINLSQAPYNISYVVLKNGILVVGEQSFLQFPESSAYRLVQKLKYEDIHVSFYKAENNLILVAVDDAEIANLSEAEENFTNFLEQNESSYNKVLGFAGETLLSYTLGKAIDYVIEHEKEAHKRVEETRRREREAFNQYGRYSPEYVQAGKERREAELNCLTCRNTFFDGKEHVGVGMHN